MRRRVLGIVAAVALIGGFLTVLPNLVSDKEPSASAANERTIAPGTNLARLPGVKATQWPESTEPWARPASLTIDGNTNGDFAAGSVNHTAVSVPNGPENPYVDIDLGASHPIDRIVVWNRTDSAARDRLRDFAVIVSENPIGGPIVNPNLMVDGVWHTNIGQVPNPNLTVPVNATGRYVRIHQRRNRHLHLAEVQVFAAGLPAAGLPAEQLPSGLSNRSEPLASGVADIATTGEQFLAADLAEVWALANVGPTMFAGGRFLNVVDNATGAKTPQRYLAAFDVATGRFKPEFRPNFSGGVSELRALADGRLLVGGAFRSVNGSTVNQGVVILDPTTGAIDPNFRLRVAGGSATVLDFDVQGDWLYLAGGFTTVSGGPGAGTTLAGFTNLARVRLSDGTPDAGWKPRVTAARPTNTYTTGTMVSGIDASDRGDRVYVAGFFGSIDNNTGAAYHAWLDATAGRVIPNLPDHVATSAEAHQWDVLEVGDRVLKVGTQHELFSSNRATKRVDGVHLARKLEGAPSGGGDMQHASLHDGWVYATCHCLGANLYWNTDTSKWLPLHSAQPPVELDVTRQQLNGVWRVDPATFQPDINFSPEIWYSSGVRGSGQGGWAVDGDDDRCMWVGGDVRETRLRTSGQRAKQGGFTRVCRVDDVVPPTPGGFAAAWEGETSARLSWQSVQDDRRGRTYEVLRNGVIIASTTDTKFVDTAAQPGDVYAVRADDKRGNRSATATPINIGARPSPVVGSIAAGSAWRYVTTAPPAGWTGPAFDAGTWASATTEAGWGDGDEVTVIPGTPLVTFLRNTVNVPADRGVNSAVLRYKRDDGIAISVNGVEVVRDNLPAGPLTATTPASVGIAGGEESAWKTVQVPTNVFRAGGNVVTVSLHQAGVRNGDATFDLDLTLRGDAASTTLTAPASAAVGATVTLNASTSVLGAERVDFRRGDTVLGSDTTSPYSFDWRAEPGVSTFTAVAVVGASSVASTPVTVSVACPTGQRAESGKCIGLPEGDVFAVDADGVLSQHRILAEGRNGGTTTIPAPPLARVEASTGPDGRTWLAGVTRTGAWVVASRLPGGAVGSWTELGTGYKDTGIVVLADTVVTVGSRTDGKTDARELAGDGTWTPSFDMQSNYPRSVSLSRTAEATPRAVFWSAASTGLTFQRIRTGTGSWSWWSQAKDGSVRDAAGASFGGATHLVGVATANSNVCIATDKGGWSGWACQGVGGATAVTVGVADHLYYASASPSGVSLGRRAPNGVWGAAFPFAPAAVDVAIAPSVGCPNGQVVRGGVCAPEAVGNLLRIEGGRLLDASVIADDTAGAPTELATGMRRVDTARAANGDLWVAVVTTGGEWRVATRGIRSDALGAWTTLGTGYKDVGIAVTASGQVTVFGLNNNGSVQARQRNGDGTWAAAVNLAGTVSYLDGMLSLDRSQPRIMATVANGTVWERQRQADGTWTGWAQIGDGQSFDIGGVTWRGDAGEVFTVGGNNTMWHMYWWYGRWVGWDQPKGATAGWTSVSSEWLDVPAFVYGGPAGTTMSRHSSAGWVLRPLTTGAVTDVALA